MALGYSQLTDADIVNLPVPRLQTDGLLFVWVINAKYKFTLDLFERWGYTCAPGPELGDWHAGLLPTHLLRRLRNTPWHSCFQSSIHMMQCPEYNKMAAKCHVLQATAGLCK